MTATYYIGDTQVGWLLAMQRFAHTIDEYNRELESEGEGDESGAQALVMPIAVPLSALKCLYESSVERGIGSVQELLLDIIDVYISEHTPK